MRKKVEESKKESKIIVDYNDDQTVKPQKTVNSRNGDAWNHDRFENVNHPNERGKTIGQNRGQRGQGSQSEQNHRGHGNRSDQSYRGRGFRSEQSIRGNGPRSGQNHRGNDSQPQQNMRGRPAQNGRNRTNEERNRPIPVHRENLLNKQDNRGRYAAGNNRGMNGRFEK